jgi:hypothetical protein
LFASVTRLLPLHRPPGKWTVQRVALLVMQQLSDNAADPHIVQARRKFASLLENTVLDYKHYHPAQLEACINTLDLIFGNVVSNPDEPKFRRVRCSRAHVPMPPPQHSMTPAPGSPCPAVQGSQQEVPQQCGLHQAHRGAAVTGRLAAQGRHPLPAAPSRVGHLRQLQQLQAAATGEAKVSSAAWLPWS